MATIAQLRAEINAKLDEQKNIYGEDVTLTQTELDIVSREVDEANETVNPNLPTRPTN